MGYSLDIKEKARALFVESGLTYDEVAKESGVSINNLKKWGSDGEWTKQRGEFEKEFMELSSKLQKLKVQLVNEALKDTDPQKIYALGNLLRVQRFKGSNIQEDHATLFIQFLEKFLTYLQEKDSEALRYVQPHLRGFAAEVKEGGRLETRG